MFEKIGDYMGNRLQNHTCKENFIKWKKEIYITTIEKQLKNPYFKDENCAFFLFQDNCLEFLPLLQNNSIDMIFADPPTSCLTED